MGFSFDIMGLSWCEEKWWDMDVRITPGWSRPWFFHPLLVNNYPRDNPISLTEPWSFVSGSFSDSGPMLIGQRKRGKPKSNGTRPTDSGTNWSHVRKAPQRSRKVKAWCRRTCRRWDKLKWNGVSLELCWTWRLHGDITNYEYHWGIQSSIMRFDQHIVV